MSKTNDGGAAYPTLRTARSIAFYCPPRYETAGGMSLRDWFAGQALAGSMVGDAEGVQSHSVMASYCYKQADAMLAARDAE